ncbi:MAG: S8 family serine peptidase [candidate division Zixibacteria bacterium]|nr:S8 family serine peptidase [candidate division Zixibacteria bacterium]
MYHNIRKVGIVIIVCAYVCGSILSAQNIPFNNCGILIGGPNECVLFLSMGGMQNVFVLENYGDFVIGDEVCVSGMIDYGCISSCSDSFLCIVDNDIVRLSETDFPYGANGVLVTAESCVVFQSFWDPAMSMTLEYYGNYESGDTVFVIGMFSDSCEGICPDAVSCLQNNTIEGIDQPPMPMQGAAVLELQPAVNPEDVFFDFNLTMSDSIDQQNFYLIRFEDNLEIGDIIRHLSQDPRIVFAEPNVEFGLPGNLQMSMSFPDESRPPLILGSSPPGYYQQGATYTIGIDSAQKIANGFEIKIAVIDNGVDFSHPMLSEILIEGGYDYLDDDNYPEYEEGTAASHGTFVTGLIALTAPKCKVLPIRAFDGDGIGNSFAIAKSIYHAIDMNVDVINMSFGMNEYNTLVEIACSTAIAAGITIVAAGGNDGSISPVYPAAFNNVIAVSAVDSNDVLATFSNFGSYIDICAPGVKLYSSLAGEYNWGTWSGTSFASALVSATCVLALDLDKDMSAAAMEKHIRNTAETKLMSGNITPHDFTYGYGRLNTANAVWSLKPGSVNCGDCNDDKTVNLADAVYLVSYIFHNGPQPVNMSIADANCDSVINLGDAIYIINYVFKSGASPCCN